MNEEEITKQPSDELQHDAALESQHDDDATQPDTVATILEKLGVSESIAASARVIVQSLREGSATSESLVRMVVQSLRHDEELKNAETQGYLRGRNEVIAAATTPPGDKSPRPLNFPIYTKRSFWDK